MKPLPHVEKSSKGAGDGASPGAGAGVGAEAGARASVGEASTMGRASDIELMTIQRNIYHAKKYFPIAPISGSCNIVYDINIMVLLYDCLDAMKVTRDDAFLLLKDLTELLPGVLSGEISRFHVVDEILRKWLVKHGGDPDKYKRQTRAFDALATLADKLLKDHAIAMEGQSPLHPKTAYTLEMALRRVSDDRHPLKDRLAPAISALMQAADTTDVETPETMACLVKSLKDGPIIAEDVDGIDPKVVVEDIKALGIRAPDKEIEHIVAVAIQSLRAQILTPEEAQELDLEIEQTMAKSLQGRSPVRRNVELDERSIASSAPGRRRKSEESSTTSLNRSASPRRTYKKSPKHKKRTSSEDTHQKQDSRKSEASGDSNRSLLGVESDTS